MAVTEKERHRLLVLPDVHHARIKFVEALLEESSDAQSDFHDALGPFPKLAVFGDIAKVIHDALKSGALNAWSEKWKLNSLGIGTQTLVQVAFHLLLGESTGRSPALPDGMWFLPFSRSIAENLQRTIPDEDLAIEPPHELVLRSLPDIPIFDPTSQPHNVWLSQATAILRTHGRNELERYKAAGYVVTQAGSRTREAGLKEIPAHHYRWAVLNLCCGLTLEQIKDREREDKAPASSTLSEAIDGVRRLLKNLS